MLKALTRPFLGFVLNPKYEKKLIEINQFSSCVLSQEEVDLQEYHVGEQGLVSLYNDLTFSGGDTTKQI